MRTCFPDSSARREYAACVSCQLCNQNGIHVRVAKEALRIIRHILATIGLAVASARARSTSASAYTSTRSAKGRNASGRMRRLAPCRREVNAAHAPTPDNLQA